MPSNISINLTKNDSIVLKGIAIAMIVFHNFFHAIEPTPIENQFFFNPESIIECFSMIFTNPLNSIHPFFSFFGHYGVPIFIFLSGYGLTKKMLSLSTDLSFHSQYPIVFDQIKKLVKLTLIGFIFYFFYFGITGRFDSLYDVWVYFVSYLIYMTGKTNWTMLYFFVSVWWFLSLLLQLYLLFPLLLRGTIMFPLSTLAIGVMTTTVTTYFAAPLAHDGLTILATPLGHLSVFVFGIYLALGFRVNVFFFIAAFIFFVLGQFDFTFFSFTNLCFVLVVLALYNHFHERLRNNESLLALGGLSMFIYIIHGEMRNEWLALIETFDNNMILTYLCFIIYVTLVLCCAILLRKTTHFFRVF